MGFIIAMLLVHCIEAHLATLEASKPQLQTITELRLAVNNTENRSHHNNIHIRGIPEARPAFYCH